MIYLFDDKKNRQIDAGWEEQRFNQFSDIIKPIYLYREIEEESKRREIFSGGSIVLFHESFFDNVLNRHHKDGIEIRNKLNEFSSENKEFLLVFFSGSKNTRNLTENVGHIPVSILYQNLEVFSNNVRNGDINLRYLLFGKNHKVEEVLLRELNIANNRIEDSVENGNPVTRNFIAVTQSGEIETPFENADYETFFTDDITDEYESDIDKYSTAIISKWFFTIEYDNIFIPISFGSTLSDFNGLRFATHIRCSNTPNRLKNIFLYSFIGYEYLVSNEYFDILKTKNIFLIDHKKAAFASAVNSSSEPLTIEELPKELKKIKLEPPKNYEDSHSIANEWAIYRWALAINTCDDDIEQIIKKVNNQLYFKYLRSIYPKEEINAIPEKELKIEYSGNPKLLYIDDEADKGWYEIFCKVLYDINGLDFKYLDEEFNSKTQDEIIKISLDKISKDDIDLVLLDFRLHPNDFITNDIHEVTGLKLLKEIKLLNPGIQVIIFSATNKIWNLQALQKERTDGFIIKESPDLTVNSNSPIESLRFFSEQITKCISDVYLKKIWSFSDEIKNAFSKNPLTTKYFPKQLTEQLNGIKYQNLLLHELDAMFEILTTNNENRFNLAMIMLYKILEYLNEIFYQKVTWDKPPVFYDGLAVDYFDQNSKTWKKPTDRISYYNRVKRSTEQIKIKVEWLRSTSNKVLNLAVKKLNVTENNILIDLISLSDYRNDFIHSDSSKRNKLKVLESKDILKWTNSVTCLIKNL